MSDLISRCELFNRLATVQTLGEAYGVIQGMQAMDAVPVVRCKDCRYWNKYPGSSAAPRYHECMVRITHIGNLYTTAEEYCSRGKRKDGDNGTD